MKRFLYFSLGCIAVVLCAAMCIPGDSSVDSVEEKAMGDYGSCANHIYLNDGEYTVIKDATCSSKGTQFRSCVVCGYKDIMEIPKNADNHSQPSSYWNFAPEPTCIEGGVKYKVCYGCNESIEKTQLPADPEAHAAKGDYVVLTEATCTAVGVKAYECKHCGLFFGHTEISVNSENHVVSENSKWQVTTLPTCAAEGVMTGFCDLCGKKAGNRAIPATGNHSASTEWTVDMSATCSADGVMSQHCTVCDTPVNETAIPSEKNAHTFSDEHTVDKAATCISQGEASRHCIYCDARTDINSLDIDSKAHSYNDEWITTKEANCSETGLKHRVCTLCNKDSVPVMIAKTEHTYPDNYEIVKESADGLSAQVKYICTGCGNEKIDIISFDDDNGSNIGPNTFMIILSATTVVKVDYENLIISNVAENMTVGTFASKFLNGSAFVPYDSNNTFLKADAIITTGSCLKHTTADGKITTYFVSVTGDLDANGSVTAADARLALRAAARLDTLDGAYFIAADVNSDSNVSAADARRILLVAAGIEKFDETNEN